MSPADQAYEYFISQGWSPVQARAIVAGLVQESGGVNLNPNARGDFRRGHPTAFGAGQWRGPRYKALQTFAANKGTQWNDQPTQWEFLNQELRGTEARAGNKLRAAQTLPDAVSATYDYWRPKAPREQEVAWRMAQANKFGGGMQQPSQPMPAQANNAQDYQVRLANDSGRLWGANDHPDPVPQGNNPLANMGNRIQTNFRQSPMGQLMGMFSGGQGAQNPAMAAGTAMSSAAGAAAPAASPGMSMLAGLGSLAGDMSQQQKTTEDMKRQAELEQQKRLMYAAQNWGWLS